MFSTDVTSVEHDQTVGSIVSRVMRQLRECCVLLAEYKEKVSMVTLCAIRCASVAKKATELNLQWLWEHQEPVEGYSQMLLLLDVRSLCKQSGTKLELRTCGSFEHATFCCLGGRLLSE